MYSLTVLFSIIVITGASILKAKESASNHSRDKRQNLGLCSWGQPAVSSCFQGFNGRYCNHGYQCDVAAGGDGQGRCCLPNSNTGGTIVNPNTGTGTGVMPSCRDGSQAVAACMNGLCGNGLVCSRSDNLCCLSGTQASCNFLGFPTGRCTNGFCANGGACSVDGYCCPTTTIGGGTLPVTPGTCPFNAPSNGVACNANTPCFQQGYICVNNVCCLHSSLRCNNGVTVPSGPCIAGQCPQQTPQGVFQQQACQVPNNLCCPV